MTISARQLETNDKILSVISWLENVTLYSLFKDIFVKIQNLKCLWNLAKFLRSTCKGAHIDQSRWASVNNFTKIEAPSQVFLKDPANFPGTPIILRNIFQCQHLMIFVLSKYMYFILILTSVFGLFIFTTFNDSYYVCTHGTYTFLHPMFWWVF